MQDSEGRCHRVKGHLGFRGKATGHCHHHAHLPHELAFPAEPCPSDALSPDWDQSDTWTHFPVSIMKTVTEVKTMAENNNNKDQEEALEERESGIRQWHPQLPGSLPTPAEQERHRVLDHMGCLGGPRTQ